MGARKRHSKSKGLGLGLGDLQSSLKVDERIRQTLARGEFVNKEDIKLAVFDIFSSRQRFKYKPKDLCQYFCSFVCCRKKRSPFFKKAQNQNHLLYARGQRKLIKELDVIHLMRSVRQSQLLFQSLLTNR